VGEVRTKHEILLRQQFEGLNLMRIQMALSGFIKLVLLSAVVLIPSVFLTAGCHNKAPKDPLTVEERKWLTAHNGKIVLAHDPNAKPIDYLDDKGRFRGLAADYVHLIEEKLNFKFNIAKIKTWDAVIQKAKKREVDVLCAMTKTPAREEWLLFTKPYIIIPTVILVRETLKETLTPEKMKGMKVTFTKGWVIDEYLRENYGNLELVPSINEKTAMDSVSLGQADAWVTALTVASILIEEHKITNLRVAGKVDMEFKLAFASRKDWPILNQIMQKGLSLISKEERSAIFNKWIHIAGAKQISRALWLGLIITAAAILLIIAATLLWNRTLRRQVAQRTMELKGELGERKRTEEALRESEERFRVIATHTPDHILIQNKDLRYAWVLNPQLGLTEEDMVGKTDFDFLSKEDAAVLTGMKKRILETGEAEFVRVPLASSKGDVQHFEGAYIPKRDPEGNVDGLIGYFRNVTERVEGEERRKNLEAQLLQSQKMESVGTLAGGIAHDFNNILGIVLGNTELAMDNIPEWNPARKNLDEARKACLRAKDVVKQILTFSRKSEIKEELFDLASVVNESLKLLRASIPTSIDIHQNIANDVDPILGDSTQIHQIMINLCTNAAHAMEENGGSLEVALDNTEIDEDTASRYPKLNPGPHVVLSVRDTGDGISPESIDRVFDPYYTTKEVGKGSGMGLAVVHGIVKGHKGYISVESEPGKGTTFKILFPAVKGKTRDESKEPRELPTGKERILFVDDEESMVDLNQQRLERLGYKVIPRTDPSEALEFFRTHPDQIDLVITDMTMPHMTGDKLAREMLKIRPDTPIILCTGYSERMSEDRALEIGIRKYIEKPIEMKKLARTVREVLDGRKTDVIGVRS